MSDPYIPDADMVEQHQDWDGETVGSEVAPAPRVSAETPDVDALEQAEEVPTDPDEDRP
jgi:hypothetical protein